jgi:uncharacterized protein YecE (DUF72 family)
VADIVLSRVYIGSAGWSIPLALASSFDTGGTHLQRCARRMTCVEINSSFYRPHAAATYARWAMSTPRGFRFAVKIPRTITHELELRRARRPFEQFLSDTGGLGERRGPLLVQLAPSFVFDRRVVDAFLAMVRARYDGPLVCEPRHASWFAPTAERLLTRHRVARVAADPARALDAERPGGWRGLVYFRLHGSPHIYWSSYDTPRLEAIASAIREQAAATEVWCVFDNTASGAAMRNACELLALLAS